MLHDKRTIPKTPLAASSILKAARGCRRSIEVSDLTHGQRKPLVCSFIARLSYFLRHLPTRKRDQRGEFLKKDPIHWSNEEIYQNLLSIE
jgi:hypothetical protein